MKNLLLGLGLALLSVTAAQAIDCAKAASDGIEGAICSSPTLLAADNAMSTAYTTALKAVGAKMAKALKADQIDWNQYRYEDCDSEEDPHTAAEAAQCLLDDTNRRVAFLSGQPQQGPGISEVALPQVLAGADGTFDEYLRYDAPKSPATKAYDAILKEELRDVNIAKSEDHVSDWYHLVLTYASPELMSFNVDRTYEEGYAHTMQYAYSINLDATGKRLTISDAFDSAATKKLEAICEAQMGDFIADPEQDADQRRGQVDSIVDDLDFWTFDAGKATLRFIEYGMDDAATCELGYDVLRPLLRSGFPLPA